MELGLDGARALVFGSSSGLGRAVAATLAAEGAAVALVSRDLAARRRCPRRGRRRRAALAGDLTTPGDAARLVAEAVAALGGLDICVVNTGGGKPGGHPRHDRCRRRERLPRDASSGPGSGAGRRAASRSRRPWTPGLPHRPQRRRGVARPRALVGDAQRRRRGRPLARPRARPQRARQRRRHWPVRHPGAQPLRSSESAIRRHDARPRPCHPPRRDPPRTAGNGGGARQRRDIPLLDQGIVRHRCRRSASTAAQPVASDRLPRRAVSQCW